MKIGSLERTDKKVPLLPAILCMQNAGYMLFNLANCVFKLFEQKPSLQELIKHIEGSDTKKCNLFI